MSDLSALPGEPEVSGAGALLRAARQKQGLHIAALAASIKVTPAKLEALEAGRYNELPDATFTRALAQSICRVLKIDAEPVLAQLPSTRDATLDKVRIGLNTPFRERPGRIDPVDWALWRRPAVWLVLLLLAAAAAFVMVPGHWLQRWLPSASRDAEAPMPSATTDVPAATPAAAAASSVVEVITMPVAEASSAPSPAPVAASAAAALTPPAASAPVPAVNATGARVRAIRATWVQASDAKGQLLISRVLQAGETVDLDGARPLRVRIGNVQGTELLHRGQPVDLASRSQNNVANVELP
ncbi:helix-turn-helix domain-containing protein [Aquabacterium sp.]|uniref:helix-turn-helix domain-containing protein n=1 Tax=Aquabacterium sp. TaxID=1872578 RepID=UPI002CEB4F84|nr:helix-turn-helix domain-containing protein [Aquabacterium sp.]HSW05777.1 helix-turn-helix domain-containing protein [Aquabacterium sp.]